MTEDIVIDVDSKVRVHRSGDNWVIQRKQPDGSYDMTDHWTGNRRSLMRWFEDNKVFPSREAERQLALLPERRSFPPDIDRKPQ